MKLPGDRQLGCDGRVRVVGTTILHASDGHGSEPDGHHVPSDDSGLNACGQLGNVGKGTQRQVVRMGSRYELRMDRYHHSAILRARSRSLSGASGTSEPGVLLMSHAANSGSTRSFLMKPPALNCPDVSQWPAIGTIVGSARTMSIKVISTSLD